MQSTLSLVKTNYKTDVKFICDIENDPEIRCNASELNQVFMNLMVNSCQAMAGGENSTLRICVKQVDTQLCISFKDTGCGMSPKTIDKIFEPFFTTKPDGEGVGMAISYGIVKRHKGRIEVTPKRGKGTHVTLYFPLSQDDQYRMQRSPMEHRCNGCFRYRRIKH